jgi:formamidopyrimidine-DNA glycosylase
MAEQLQKYLPGYYITGIKGELASKIPITLPRQIIGVTVKGKKIIFILDSDIYLVTNLGMTGHWEFKTTHHTRIIVSIESGNNKGNNKGFIILQRH